jgi:hypothetical protein
VKLYAALLFAFCTCAVGTESWVPIGTSPTAEYSILPSTMEADMETTSVQFTMRTELKVPTLIDGARTKSFTETILILCEADTIVTMNRDDFDGTGAHVGEYRKLLVYLNKHEKDSIISGLIQQMCPEEASSKPYPEPQQLPKRVTPLPDGGLSFRV